VAAGALVAPSFGAFIAEQSGERDRGKVYGIAEALFWIVAVIGPPLGGFVAGRFGFRRMFLLGGCLYGFATIIRIWMAGTACGTAASPSGKLSWDSLRGGLGAMVTMVLAGGLVTWIMITDGVRDVAFRLSGELMPLYLREVGGISVENIGYLGAVFGIGMVITSMPAGWLSDKFGEWVVIVGGFVLESVALMLLVSVRSLIGFGLVWLTFGVGVGLMRPAYQSLVSKAVPEKLRGTAFGLFQSSIGAISFPAPWLGAQMWERFSPRTPFVLTAWLTLATVVPVWVKFRLPRTEVEEQSPAIGREPR
jgi:MFS family permease